MVRNTSDQLLIVAKEVNDLCHTRKKKNTRNSGPFEMANICVNVLSFNTAKPGPQERALLPEKQQIIINQEKWGCSKSETQIDKVRLAKVLCSTEQSHNPCR